MTPSQIAAETAAAPILNIVGEKVALGPQTKDLAPLMTRWTNDFEVALYSGDDLRPTSVGLQEAHYEKASKDWQTHTTEFITYEPATLRPIGAAGGRRVDAVRRPATCGLPIA